MSDPEAERVDFREAATRKGMRVRRANGGHLGHAVPPAGNVAACGFEPTRKAMRVQQGGHRGAWSLGSDGLWIRPCRRCKEAMA